MLWNCRLSFHLLIVFFAAQSFVIWWSSASPIFASVVFSAAAAAKSLQSCLTLCDPIDENLPGSPVPGILQARTLEWVAFSFSNARKWKVKVKVLSRARLLVTPWTAAYQASPSMGFSRQKYWSGVHCLLLLCLHLLSNQKKKKVIAKTSVKELTHFDFLKLIYLF